MHVVLKADDVRLVKCASPLGDGRLKYTSVNISHSSSVHFKFLAGTVYLTCGVEVRQTTLNLAESFPNTHRDVEWFFGASEEVQANDDANHRCVREFKRLVRPDCSTRLAQTAPAASRVLMQFRHAVLDERGVQSLGFSC